MIWDGLKGFKIAHFAHFLNFYGSNLYQLWPLLNFFKNHYIRCINDCTGERYTEVLHRNIGVRMA